jgi:hypothetical protein
MSRILEKQDGNKNDEQDDGAQSRAGTQEFCRRFPQASRA